MRLGPLLFSCAFAYAAGDTDLRMMSSFTKQPSKRRLAAGNSGQRDLVVFPGDAVIPQFVNGGGWKTSVTLVNLARDRMSFTLDFWTSAGGFWQVPVVGAGTGDTLSGNLAPGASVTLETNGLGALQQGWAELSYDFNIGYIAGLAVFRQSVAGRPDFEAVVPLTNFFERRVVLPYDNLAGFSTGVGLVNGSGTSSSAVSVTFRDESGAPYLSDTINLGVNSHMAFSIPARYPSTQGRRGSVEFQANGRTLSVLGLRFNPGGAFTSFHGLTTIDLIR